MILHFLGSRVEPFTSIVLKVQVSDPDNDVGVLGRAVVIDKRIQAPTPSILPIERDGPVRVPA